MNNPEKFNNNHESVAELDTTNIESAEKIEDKYEKSNERSHEDQEKKAEEARAEVLKTAIEIDAAGKKSEKEVRPSSTPRHSIITKKQKAESYKRTMKRVQSELPVHERTFSKIIHNNAIEKTSNVVGATIARPNSILYGAFSAFLLTLVTYSVAKTIGYKLSGSETIIAFSVGWIIGIVIDYLKALFTSKK